MNKFKSYQKQSAEHLIERGSIIYEARELPASNERWLSRLTARRQSTLFVLADQKLAFSTAGIGQKAESAVSETFPAHSGPKALEIAVEVFAAGVHKRSVTPSSLFSAGHHTA